VRISSRRGSVDAPVRLDIGLRPGQTCMTFHLPDHVYVNLLTIDATVTSGRRSGSATGRAGLR